MIQKQGESVTGVVTDFDREDEIVDLFRRFRVQDYSLDKAQESLEKFFLEQIEADA